MVASPQPGRTGSSCLAEDRNRISGLTLRSATLLVPEGAKVAERPKLARTIADTEVRTQLDTNVVYYALKPCKQMTSYVIPHRQPRI